MGIFQAAFIHIFGQHSDSPRRTAALRILVAIGLATAIDVIITHSLGSVRLPTDIPTTWQALGLIMAMQVVSALVMLILSASGVGQHDDQLGDLLSVLPVGNQTRWQVAQTGGFVLLGVLCLSVIGPLIVLASIMHTALWLVGLALVTGLVSGVGIGTYHPHRWLVVNVSLMILTIAAEWQLFDHMMLRWQLYQDPNIWAFAALVSLIIVPTYWIARSIVGWSRRQQYQVQRLNAWMKLRQPARSWFAIKALRYPKVLRSTLVISLVSAGIAALWLKSAPAGLRDIHFILMATSFCAALTVSDVRSLTRPLAAPEMIMVKGSRRFVSQQLGVALMLALITTAPLTLAVVLGTKPTLAVTAQLAGQLLVGGGVALFANTLFVPNGQEIFAEFFGASISTGLIIGLEKLLAIERLAQHTFLQVAVWLGLIIVILSAIYVTESRRNHYYWKEKQYV